MGFTHQNGAKTCETTWRQHFSFLNPQIFEAKHLPLVSICVSFVGEQTDRIRISGWCNKSVLTQPCCQISTHETSCNKLSEHIQDGPMAAPNKLSHHWLILVATSADAPLASLTSDSDNFTHLALLASVKSALAPLTAATATLKRHQTASFSTKTHQKKERKKCQFH